MSVQFTFQSAFKIMIIFHLAFGIKSATACVVLSLVVNAMPRYLYKLTTSTSTSAQVHLLCPSFLNTTILVFARFTSSFCPSAYALRLFSCFADPLVLRTPEPHHLQTAVRKLLPCLEQIEPREYPFPLQLWPAR